MDYSYAALSERLLLALGQGTEAGRLVPWGFVGFEGIVGFMGLAELRVCVRVCACYVKFGRYRIMQ